MKRTFSILLALLLGLSLLAPAMASWLPHTPVITKPLEKLYLAKFGDTLTLEIVAECREGYEGELSYAWHIEGDRTTIATEPKIELDSTILKTYGFVVVDVTNTYTDENGETQTNTLTHSGYVAVYHCRFQKPFLLLWHHIAEWYRILFVY